MKKIESGFAEASYCLKFWIVPRLLTLFLLMICMCSAAYAQSPTPLDYCYTDANGTKCFSSLPKAVASLKTHPSLAPTAQYLQLISTKVLYPITGETEYQYGYKYVPASQIYLPSYNKYLHTDEVAGNFGCAPATSPYKPGWCASESALLTLSENFIKGQPTSEGCTFTPFQLEVDYLSPYQSLARVAFNTGTGYVYPGVLNHGTKKYTATKTCPTFTTTSRIDITKHTTFDCPAGFDAETDTSNAAPNLEFSLVCKPKATHLVGSPPVIKSFIRQIASCIATSNPCHPATGDKSRAETDFEFAGRPFTRYYHSRAEFRDQNGSAIGWSHTYSERMQKDANLNPYMFTSEGHYEGFKKIGANTSKHFRAYNSPDRFVDTFTTGTVRYRLRDGSGEVREYDVNGLLLSIRNPDDPSGDVLLQYNATGRLLSLTDNNGRKLTFDYDYSLSLLTKITLPDGAVVNYEYDADFNLTAVDFGGGARKLYHYHEAGLAGPEYINHLTGITSENNVRFATFGYDAYGRVTSSKLHGPAGHVATTTVNYTGADTATVNTDTGDTRSYSMAPGIYRRVTAYGDGAGSSTSQYDPDGRVQSKTDKRGMVSQYEYTDNYLSAINSAVGTLEARRVVMVRDLNNRLTRREYYGLSAGAQQLQRIESIVYNSDGRASFSCEADALNSVAAAYTCGSLVNAPAGVRQSAYVYCNSADVATVNNLCPRLGLIKSIDGPRTDVNDLTTYEYRSADAASCVTAPNSCPYRKGDLWKVYKTASSISLVTEYITYDGAGRVLQMKDFNGVITDLEYNTRGWLTASKVRGLDDTGEFYDDVVTRMDYDPIGQVTKLTQPDLDYINFTYDAAHRLTDVSDRLGNSIHYELNDAGERTKEEIKDPDGNLTNSMASVYDTLGRLHQSKNAADGIVASFTYDADGNLGSMTDALSRLAVQEVDSHNRVKKTTLDVGGVNAMTQFEYDARDNLAKVIDSKNLNTTYSYNGLNELINLSSPDTGNKSYTHDGAGNRRTQTDAKGVLVNYNYDELNRVKSVTYANAALNSEFFYDTVNSICTVTETFSKGHLTKFTDPSGTTEYCYDRFGNKTRKQNTNNGVVTVVSFTYTKSGRLSSMTYPSGMIVYYARDSIGRVMQVSIKQGTATKIFANNITYYPFGPLSRIEFVPPGSANANPTAVEPSASRVSTSAAAGGGGCVPQPGGCTPVPTYTPVVQTRVYDLDYEVQSIGGLYYEVDDVGNIKSINDLVGGNDYEYDSLDRLTAVKDSNTAADVTTLTYDATGNRLTKQIGTGTAESYAYASASHQLTAVASEARLLDANGNITKAASNKFFTYDDRNRMVDFRSDSGTIVRQYQYNAKGERVRKYSGETTYASYSYDDGGKLLSETKLNILGNLVTQEIIWLDNMPIGLNQNGALNGILTDHLNTPRQVFLMSNQQTQWRWNAADDAFGESLAVETGVELDLRFPGQLYDSESGLHYNRFRDYEPGTGRYSQSDPIGLDGGMSTYGYVFGSPLTLTDVAGLSSDAPGYGDQVNPLGIRGPGERNYTAHFNKRFPKTIAGGKALFDNRIKQKICANKKGFPKSVVGIRDGSNDIDITPDMGRFGDTPQGFNERELELGFFQLKTTDINVKWTKLNGCDCFGYSSSMYVLENTGDNWALGMAVERDVVMGRWSLMGRGCCEK